MRPNDSTPKDYTATIIQQKKSINVSQQATLSLIIDLSRNYGYCFAQNNFLTKKLGICARQLQRQIKQLAGMGYIDVVYISKTRRHIHVRDKQIKKNITCDIVNNPMPEYVPKNVTTDKQNVAPCLEWMSYPFQRQMSHIDITNSLINNNIYIYKKKLVKEGGVGETNPKKCRMYTKKIVVNNAVMTWELSDLEMAKLRDIIPPEELPGRIERTRAFCIKKHPKAYAGKNLYEIILIFWYNDQLKKAQSQEQAKMDRERSNKDILRDLISKNPKLTRDLDIGRTYVLLSYSMGAQSSIGFCDRDFEDRLIQHLDKVSKYYGVPLTR